MLKGIYKVRSIFESFCIYFGFEIIKQAMQSKKSTININKVFGTRFPFIFRNR